MAKHADHDATMEGSTSQLVPDAPRAPRPPISPDDVSAWEQVVVSTDDFAPPPAVRPGRRRRLAIVACLVAGIAAGLAFAWYRHASAAPAAAPAPSTPTPPPR